MFGADFVVLSLRIFQSAVAALDQLAERSGCFRLAGRNGTRRVLVLGGSQGARALNAAVPQALAGLRIEQAIEVRHQCGARHVESAQQAYAEAGVAASVEPFIADMAEANGWADLVICRAGALTLAELAAVGVAAILVPFPHAVDDHQTRNARYAVEAGAAVLMPEATLTPLSLAAKLRELLEAGRPRLLAMAQAARRTAITDADERLADACVAVAGGSA